VDNIAIGQSPRRFAVIGGMVLLPSHANLLETAFSGITTDGRPSTNDRIVPDKSIPSINSITDFATDFITD
jgi:hypothetical protein